MQAGSKTEGEGGETDEEEERLRKELLLKQREALEAKKTQLKEKLTVLRSSAPEKSPHLGSVVSPRREGEDYDGDNEELIFSEENEAVMVQLRASVTAGLALRIRELYGSPATTPVEPVRGVPVPATPPPPVLFHHPSNGSANEVEPYEDFMAKRRRERELKLSEWMKPIDQVKIEAVRNRSVTTAQGSGISIHESDTALNLSRRDAVASSCDTPKVSNTLPSRTASPMQGRGLQVGGDTDCYKVGSPRKKKDGVTQLANPLFKLNLFTSKEEPPAVSPERVREQPYRDKSMRNSIGPTTPRGSHVEPVPFSARVPSASQPSPTGKQSDNVPRALTFRYSKKKEARQEKASTIRLLAFPSTVTEQDVENTQPGPVLIDVVVISAQDLSPKSNGGVRNVFCKLSIAGQKQRTRAVKSISSPYWNETFRFLMPFMRGQVYITVWDQRLRKTRCIGHTFTPSIQLLGDSPSVGGWLPIQEKKGNAQVGSIKVVMHIRRAGRGEQEQGGDQDGLTEKDTKLESPRIVYFNGYLLDSDEQKRWFELTETKFVGYSDESKREQQECYRLEHLVKVEKQAGGDSSRMLLRNSSMMRLLRGRKKISASSTLTHLAREIDGEATPMEALVSFSLKFDNASEEVVLSGDKVQVALWMLAIHGLRNRRLHFFDASMAEHITLEFLQLLYFNERDGGTITSLKDGKMWKYSKGGILSTEDEEDLLYLWNGQELLSRGATSYGEGKWNGVYMAWLKNPSEETRFRYKWNVLKRLFISSEHTHATWTWSDDTHLLSDKNDGGGWEIDGDVPEPVVMMLQLLIYAIEEKESESGDQEVSNTKKGKEKEKKAAKQQQKKGKEREKEDKRASKKLRKKEEKTEKEKERLLLRLSKPLPLPKYATEPNQRHSLGFSVSESTTPTHPRVQSARGERPMSATVRISPRRGLLRSARENTERERQERMEAEESLRLLRLWREEEKRKQDGDDKQEEKEGKEDNPKKKKKKKKKEGGDGGNKEKDKKKNKKN